MSSDTSFSKEQIHEGKVFALLSYLSIFCIIPLVLKRDNPFILEHSKQGLVLFIGEVASFVVSIILPGLVIKCFYFIFGVLSLWGIIASIQGRFVKMPIAASIAQKIIL